MNIGLPSAQAVHITFSFPYFNLSPSLADKAPEERRRFSFNLDSSASGMEGAPSGASRFAVGDREYGTPAQPDPVPSRAERDRGEGGRPKKYYLLILA